MSGQPEEYLGDGPFQPEDEPMPRVFKGVAVALIVALSLWLGWLLGLAWNWG